MEAVKKEHIFGGKGFVWMKPLYSEDQFHGKGRLYAEVTIEPGNEFGYHVHDGDSESYYIVSGEGEYNDNGTVRTVKAGDLTYTKSGEGHGMINNGKENLVYMALILFDK